MKDIWLRPDEAAVRLNTTLANVYVLAHRRDWSRIGRGPSLRYSYEDVDTEAIRRARISEELANFDELT